MTGRSGAVDAACAWDPQRPAQTVAQAATRRDSEVASPRMRGACMGESKTIRRPAAALLLPAVLPDTRFHQMPISVLVYM